MSWNPVVFPTNPPAIEQLVDKSVSNNSNLAISIALIVISIVLSILFYIDYKYQSLNFFKQKITSKLYSTHTIGENVIWISIIVTLALTSIILFSVELNSSTLYEVNLARKREQIAFCTFFFILICFLMNCTYNSQTSNLKFNLFIYTLCGAGALSCLILATDACMTLPITNNEMLCWSIVFMFVGFVFLVNGIWKKHVMGDTNLTILLIGSLTVFITFITSMVAVSQEKPTPQGLPIPPPRILANPKDLSCININMTVTQTNWTNISRLRFVFNVNYLTPSGDSANPFLPMNLIVATKNDGSSDTEVLAIRYADKKLFAKVRNVPNELAIDVTPGKLYVSLVFVTYEDTDGRKIGTIEFFDEYNTDKVSHSNLLNQGSPSDWGNVTIRVSKNPSNNNADVIEGLQLCLEPPIDSFLNVPIGYKICLFIVLIIVVAIVMYFLTQYSPKFIEFIQKL